MHIDENVLTIAAAAAELGLPVVLLLLIRFSRAAKPKAVVMLGAVCPLLCFYVFATIEYLISPKDPGAIFAFFAMWVMSFAVYAAAALLGLMIAFFRTPTKTYARFIVGLASLPLSLGLLELAARLYR